MESDAWTAVDANRYRILDNLTYEEIEPIGRITSQRDYSSCASGSFTHVIGRHKENGKLVRSAEYRSDYVWQQIERLGADGVELLEHYFRALSWEMLPLIVLG